MKVLEYIGLDVSRVKAQYAKVREAIERDDFRQAEVKSAGGGMSFLLLSGEDLRENTEEKT